MTFSDVIGRLTCLLRENTAATVCCLLNSNSKPRARVQHCILLVTPSPCKFVASCHCVRHDVAKPQLKYRPLHYNNTQGFTTIEVCCHLRWRIITYIYIPCQPSTQLCFPLYSHIPVNTINQAGKAVIYSNDV